MSLLGETVAALNGALKTLAGEGATYRRGNQTIADLVIVPGNVRTDGYGDADFDFTGREADWIIAAADLVKGGQAWTPERGDVIETTIAGVSKRFEVLPRGNDDRVFRHTDQTRVQLRVFTLEQ